MRLSEIANVTQTGNFSQPYDRARRTGGESRSAGRCVRTRRSDPGRRVSFGGFGRRPSDALSDIHEEPLVVERVPKEERGRPKYQKRADHEARGGSCGGLRQLGISKVKGNHDDQADAD